MRPLLFICMLSLSLSLSADAQHRASSDPAVMAGEAIVVGELSSEDLQDLRFVAESLGLSVAHAEGRVGQRGTELSGNARVTYDTESSADSCIARQTTFVATSSIDESLQWQRLETVTPEYVFWFDPCSNIEFDAGLLSRHYPDLAAFRQLYTLRDEVITVAVENRDRLGDVEPATYRLRGINTEIQGEHLNYSLEYEGPSCHWLAVTVNLTGDTFSIVDSGGWVC